MKPHVLFGGLVLAALGLVGCGGSTETTTGPAASGGPVPTTRPGPGTTVASPGTVLSPSSSAGSPSTASTERSTGGGGSSSSQPPVSKSTQSGTKASYVEKAKAVCQDMNRAQSALMANAVGGSDADAAKGLSQTADIFAKAAADLRALPQPPGDEAPLGDIYTQIDHMVDITRKAAVAVVSDKAEFNRLTSQMPPMALALASAMQKYGIDCMAPSGGR